MATIINMSGGSIYPVLLASVTNVSTSSTAISGTENWKKYDAIYYECFVHFHNPDDKAIFTHLILTNNISLGGRYFLLRTNSPNASGDEINLISVFSENVIKMNKANKVYDVTKLNIYGVNF